MAGGEKPDTAKEDVGKPGCDTHTRWPLQVKILPRLKEYEN